MGAPFLRTECAIARRPQSPSRRLASPTRFRLISPIQTQPLRATHCRSASLGVLYGRRAPFSHTISIFLAGGRSSSSSIFFSPYRSLPAQPERPKPGCAGGGRDKRKKNPSVLTWAFREPAWGSKTRLKLQTCNPAVIVKGAIIYAQAKILASQDIRTLLYSSWKFQ